MSHLPKIPFCQSLLKDYLDHADVFGPLLVGAIGACSFETFNSLRVSLPLTDFRSVSWNAYID